MPYTPNSEVSFAAQHESTEAYEKSQGTKLERYMDDIYEYANEIIEKWALISAADITALRALYDDANWDSSTTQQPARDLQVRRVEAASDGTSTFIALYWFDEGNSSTDVDGATGNVDTDGIVSPLSGRATGRWLRLCAVGNDGTAAYVHRSGIEALRTMTQNLYINLTAGSVDLALKFNKRTAGSQVKITTDEEIAIRNIADNAYEDLSIGLLTTSGNITGAGTANVLSGAPVASATSALLRLGAANTGGSASGGFISVNSATGYAGDFIRILLDGVARLTLSNAGNLVTAGTITGTAIAGTTGTFSGALSSTTASHTGAMNMNAQLINNVLDPVSAQDAATRAWVLSQIASVSPYKLLFNQTANVTVTAASATTLISTGSGTATIAANTLVAGDKIIVKAWGYVIGGAGSVRTLQLVVPYSGGANVNIAIPDGYGTANDRWLLQREITVKTIGAGGTCLGGSTLIISVDNATAQYTGVQSDSADVSINTTIANALTLTAAWDATTNGPTITCMGVSLEVYNVDT